MERQELAGVLLAITVLLPCALALNIPPISPGTSGPKLVGPDEPYAFELIGDCGFVKERELESFQLTTLGRAPAPLDRPRSVFYRAGIHQDPVQMSWSDWTEGANLGMFWYMVSVGRSLSRKGVMEGGLEAQDRIHVVVPPEPGLSGEVRVTNKLDIPVALVQATNLDWPELDEKTLEAETLIWLRNVRGQAYSSSRYAKIVVPTSSTSGAGGSLGLSVDAKKKVSGSGGVSISSGHGASGGDGFRLNLGFVIPQNPVVDFRSFGFEGFNDWFEIASGARSMLKVEERDWFYDGSRMVQRIYLKNQWQRVQVVCERRIGDGIKGGGRKRATAQVVSPLPPQEAEAVLATAAPELQLELAATVGQREQVAGALRVSSGGNGTYSVEVTALPAGIVAVHTDQLRISGDIPDLLVLEALEPGVATLELRDVSGLLPTLRKDIEVTAADSGKIELSFLELMSSLGELHTFDVFTPASSNLDQVVKVVSSNPAVCTINGEAQADQVVKAGEHKASFVVRCSGEGDSILNVSIPRRGLAASATVTGYRADTSGLCFDLSDGEVVTAPRVITFELKEDHPSGLVLTWRCQGDPGATVDGQAFGVLPMTSFLPAGHQFELPFDPGSGLGAQVEFSWTGMLHGSRSVFVHGSPGGLVGVFQSLISILTRIEGSSGGTYTKKAMLARLNYATGKPEHAAENLAHMLRSLDNPGWGGSAYSQIDRDLMKAEIEQAIRLLHLDSTTR